MVKLIFPTSKVGYGKVTLVRMVSDGGKDQEIEYVHTIETESLIGQLDVFLRAMQDSGGTESPAVPSGFSGATSEQVINFLKKDLVRTGQSLMEAHKLIFALTGQLQEADGAAVEEEEDPPATELEYRERVCKELRKENAKLRGQLELAVIDIEARKNLIADLTGEKQRLKGQLARANAQVKALCAIKNLDPDGRPLGVAAEEVQRAVNEAHNQAVDAINGYKAENERLLAENERLKLKVEELMKALGAGQNS